MERQREKKPTKNSNLIPKALYLHGFIQSFSKICRFISHALYCKGNKNRRIKANKNWRRRSSKPLQPFLSEGVYSVKMQFQGQQTASTIQSVTCCKLMSPCPVHSNILFKALMLPDSKCQLPKHHLGKQTISWSTEFSHPIVSAKSKTLWLAKKTNSICLLKLCKQPARARYSISNYLITL